MNAKDGGAPIFALLIDRIRELQPGCSIGSANSRFQGDRTALKIVMDARPKFSITMLKRCHVCLSAAAR